MIEYKRFLLAKTASTLIFLKMLLYRNKKTEKYCQTFSDFGIMGTKRFNLFSQGTVDLPKLANRSNLGSLVVRLFKSYFQAGGGTLRSQIFIRLS